MKTANGVWWLLFACICLAEARYKIRRHHVPASLPSKIMFQKPWPMGHRMPMGNAIHVAASFPPKRMTHKIPNYRIRRPPLFNVLPTMWKNQLPIRAAMNNHPVLPQRPPVKEFHSMNKMPEYSPEYRPEVTVLPPTHRGGIDDDKGPIHTIPAPNLSPLDRPFNSEIHSQEAQHIRQYTADNEHNLNVHGPLVPNIDLSTIGTSLQSQRVPTTPTPTQHQYEVTESNDIGQNYHSVLPTFLPPDFDVSRLSTIVNPDLQAKEVFLNQHPGPNMGLIGTNIHFGQPNAPMQTNLHSSLHVGFPGTAGQAPYLINQQIPDLHVGHTAPAGAPLSATQLYDLLNSFPQKITEQYQSGQQPQLQQHILQQQLGQFFQPAGVPGFSQPQMHSFNYNEQDNKEQQQQQQQILLGQEYHAQGMNSDYNIDAEPSAETEDVNAVPENEEVGFVNDGTDQLENNIEYEETDNQHGQTTYFSKIGNNGGTSTKFYTTLPSREAAEKLAALAAAGNVNSHLIGQLRKQQQENLRDDESIPANHKDEDYEGQVEDDNQYDDSQTYQDGERYQTGIRPELDQGEREGQMKEHDRQRVRQQHRQRPGQFAHNEKRPLRIMVPDDNTDTNKSDRRNGAEKESMEAEYEYENDEADAANSFDGKTSYEQTNAEFGTRLSSKTGK